MTVARPDRGTVARFGFRLSGIPLLVPESTRALFLPAAGVDPMPLAPPRLRGFTQRHGRSVPVFDASAQAPSRLPVRTRRPLLVFEDLIEPAALLVDAPPTPVGAPLTRDAARLRPEIGWREAIGDASVDPQGGAWWSIDLARLFDLLARP